MCSSRYAIPIERLMSNTLKQPEESCNPYSETQHPCPSLRQLSARKHTEKYQLIRQGNWVSLYAAEFQFPLLQPSSSSGETAAGEKIETISRRRRRRYRLLGLAGGAVLLEVLLPHT